MLGVVPWKDTLTVPVSGASMMAHYKTNAECYFCFLAFICKIKKNLLVS